MPILLSSLYCFVVMICIEGSGVECGFGFGFVGLHVLTMSMAVGFNSQPHTAPVNHHAIHEAVVCDGTPERSVPVQVGVRRSVYWPAVDAVHGFTLLSSQHCHGDTPSLFVSRVTGSQQPLSR